MKRIIFKIRFAYEQSYASIFLNRAYFCSDKIERLKYVTTFAFANLHLSVMQTKPFTPILGETSQITIGDMDIYLENTLSKPPTINFYGKSKYFKIYGNIALYAETGANSVTAKKKGCFYVEFLDNHVKDIYRIWIPVIYVNGILLGKRLYNFVTPMVVDSLNSDLSVFINFNPDKRGSFASIIGLTQKTFPDFAKGGIVSTNEIQIDTAKLQHKCKLKNVLCEVDAEWTNYIRFGKTKYWSKEEYKIPDLLQQYNERNEKVYIIPSDSIYRKDIQAFKIDDKDEAQKWKEKYEQIQRDDRTLRKKISKN